MGWLSGALIQAVIASVVLGALKTAGVIRVNPQAIENAGVRSVFVQAVEFGESVAEKGQRLLDEFTKK